jgi:hypothetical protein
MRYNTVICEIEKVHQQVNGDLVLKGTVTAALGEDYEPGQAAQFVIPAKKSEYLDGARPGTYLLERVDGDSGVCAFPSVIRDGKSAFPAWVGPIQASWTDERKQFHVLTLDKAGLEGDALEQASQALRKHAATLRVFRDLVEIDDEGLPRHAMDASAARWQDAVAGLIEDLPDMTSVIVRDGERAVIARLQWDGETETRKLVPPTLKDGTLVSFRNDTVELIPVFQMNYLTNRMNPKKSTAVTTLVRETDKTEKQQAFEAKLYANRGTFATGVAICRNLPSGGRTLEQVAASFPSMGFKHLPGSHAVPDNTVRSQSATRSATDPVQVLRDLGIPEDRIAEVMAMANGGNAARSAESRPEAARRPAERTGDAASRTAATTPAAERPAERPAARAAAETRRAPETPAPTTNPTSDVRTAPKVTFGRRR